MTSQLIVELSLFFRKVDPFTFLVILLLAAFISFVQILYGKDKFITTRKH